jgi:hypothetical protein
MKKIDIEAHFYTKEYQDYLLSRKDVPREEIYKSYMRLRYAPQVWEPQGMEIGDRLLEAEFMEHLPVSAADKEKIGHPVAEKLFKINYKL